MKDTLSDIFPADRLLTDPKDLRMYAFDGTAGIPKCLPAVVAFPVNAEEISKTLKYARAHKTPVVTRGSGTGLSGGSVPVEGAIVLCLVKMDAVIEFDEKNLALLVESGTVTKTIDDLVSSRGLFYPPDPGSMKISTIGGNVANNSGGLRGLKYGVTRDYVMGMEVVLPDGEIAWLGSKCVKDVAGYSMKDIFVGSEGTLGIITKVLLKLIPKPAARRTLLATFDTMEAAAETVSSIIAAKIIPCTIEFLDRKTIQCVEAFAQVGLPDCAALLFMETDGHEAVVGPEADAMANIAKAQGAASVTIAQDDVQAVKLAAARRSAFAALARIKPTTILEDATVPRSELAKMVAYVNQVAEKYNLDIATFGHMGDGNLHPTVLTDEKNKEEMERVEKALLDIFDYAISLGGTITGEHGVGIAKRDFLPRQFDTASFQLMKQIKKALDPDNILNPDKIFLS